MKALAEQKLRGMAAKGEKDVGEREVVYHHCSLAGVGVSGNYKSIAN